MRKTKYKAGDKVRVRNNLEDNTTYRHDDGSGEICVIAAMLAYKGQSVKIYDIEDGRYRIKNLNGEELCCYWTDGMFEPAKREPKYKVGDKVRIRGGLIVGNVYDTLLFLDGMAQHTGEVGEVREARLRSDGSGYPVYRVFGYWFTEPMLVLEPAKPETKPERKKKVKCNKKVKIETDGINKERNKQNELRVNF